MLSSTILCIAALAAAAPSLAAPSTAFAPQYAKRSQGSAVWAPHYQPNRVVPGRYQGSWPPAGYRSSNTRADIDEQSGASFWSTIVHAIPTVIKIANKVLNGKRDGQLSAREFEEVFSRELEQEFSRQLLAARDVDPSGAFNWGGLINSIPSIVNTVSSWFKRGELEAIIQARDDIESGAWNWGNFLGSIPGIAQKVGSWFKREDLEEFLARADLEARSLNDLD